MSDVSTGAVAPQATEAATPNPNMTGAEAVAWVESQKAAKVKSANPKDPGFADAPSKETAVADAAKEAKRRLKISDNEEVDEDEVLKVYRERKGHQQAANKALQEGRTLRKQAEEFIQMMKDEKTFFEVAQRLGHDPRSLSEKKLAEMLEEELLDPKEKELRATRRRLEEYEKREKEQKEAEELQLRESLKRKYAEQYERDFVEALKTSGLPQTKEMVGKMAQYIARAAKLNYEITAKEASELVKQDLRKMTESLMSQSDGEVLLALLGEENLKKIRKYDTERLKDPSKLLKTPIEQPEGERPRVKPGKHMTPAEWRAYNRGY